MCNLGGLIPSNVAFPYHCFLIWSSRIHLTSFCLSLSSDFRLNSCCIAFLYLSSFLFVSFLSFFLSFFSLSFSFLFFLFFLFFSFHSYHHCCFMSDMSVFPVGSKLSSNKDVVDNFIRHIFSPTPEFKVFRNFRKTSTGFIDDCQLATVLAALEGQSLAKTVARHLANCLPSNFAIHLLPEVKIQISGGIRGLCEREYESIALRSLLQVYNTLLNNQVILFTN